MAAVTASAVWPADPGYTGGSAVYGKPVPNPSTVALAQAPGYSTSLPVLTQASPRAATPVSAQAARWLFPPVTAVPAPSPFTRYPSTP